MQILKKVCIFLFVFLIMLAVIFGVYCCKNWTIRFNGRLDRFFGEDNWKCVSSEGKDSIIYSDRVYDRTQGVTSVPGRYRNWNIAFTDKNGTEILCRITDHAARINHSEHLILSPKWLSNPRALTLELLDVACGLIEIELFEDVKGLELPDFITDNLRIRLTYKGGNPRPKFYTELWNESWFNIYDISAAHFLALDSHDFFIDVTVSDSAIDNLSDEDLQLVLNSLEILEVYLLDEYGNNASFEISFGSEYCVEFIDGVKQE